MPTNIEKEEDISPGEYYEDCSYHPCLCIRVENSEVDGISLVDGSYPRSCDIGACGIRKLTYKEALRWKFRGPSDVKLEDKYKWWPLDTEFTEMYDPKS